MQVIDRDNMLFDSVTSDGWRGPSSAQPVFAPL
jgi:hypothetical protein